MKNVLFILGHPTTGSLCDALLKAYGKGAAENDIQVRWLRIGELDFNPNLLHGYHRKEELVMEPDLLRAQEDIRWADHVVMVYPTWWGSMPAITKGFIDRVLMPGFAFNYVEGDPFPEKLLKGKSIRLMVTMDSPKFWFHIVYSAAQYTIMRKQIFGFVGFDPVRFTTFGAVRTTTSAQREKWLQKAEDLGRGLI